jgi:hypothetical protein
MSSPENAKPLEGTVVVPYRRLVDGEPFSPRARLARRLIVPVAIAAIAGCAGWYLGAQSSLAVAAYQAEAERAIMTDMRAQAASIASLEARLKGVEEAPRADVSALKPALDILARRVDEIARAQTAGLAQQTARSERIERDLTQRVERMGERVERVEKQVSSSATVGSVNQTNTSSVARGKNELPDVPNYVLRDVFRGGAIIEGRHGLIEVAPGATLPGAGRVRSVERRDGRWVVVTTTGLIEARR